MSATDQGGDAFAVDEFMLVAAFRYALGRQSTAPSHVAGYLRTYWPQLQHWTRAQIRREIADAIEHGCAGQDCDVQTWRAVAALKEP